MNTAQSPEKFSSKIQQLHDTQYSLLCEIFSQLRLLNHQILPWLPYNVTLSVFRWLKELLSSESDYILEITFLDLLIYFSIAEMCVFNIKIPCLIHSPIFQRLLFVMTQESTLQTNNGYLLMTLSCCCLLLGSKYIFWYRP